MSPDRSTGLLLTMPFVGVPLFQLLILNPVARPGARGVRCICMQSIQGLMRWFQFGRLAINSSKWFSAFGPKASGNAVLVRKDSEALLLNRLKHLTSSVTGPADGVASPLPFGGFSLLHLLNLNSVARSGARGVR
jgi:hypothetical protein